jgi:cytochrome c-type biogenesis protein CcmH/NrfG
MRILGCMVLVWLFVSCKTTRPMTQAAGEGTIVYSNNDPKSMMSPALQKDVFTSSQARLQKSAEANPSQVGQWLNLAKVELARGRYDEALNATRKALRFDITNSEAKMIQAQIALKRSQTDLAEILLNGLGGDSSTDAHVLNLLALVRMQQKDPTAALFLWRQAVDKDTGNVAARMNLGVAYLAYRQLREAARQFERVIQLMPQNLDAKVHLATIYTIDGKHDEAARIYQEALSYNRENPLVLYNFAILESRRERYKEAADRMKAYLLTDYAKSTQPQDAFAFIQKMNDAEQQRTGKKISDAEIQDLAKDFNNPKQKKNERAKQVEIPAMDETEYTPAAAARMPGPAKAEAEPKPAVPDDIDELEKMLLR